VSKCADNNVETTKSVYDEIGLESNCGRVAKLNERKNKIRCNRSTTLNYHSYFTPVLGCLRKITQQRHKTLFLGDVDIHNCFVTAVDFIHTSQF